jgi:drug/metabolite transporter (DMT)-like permease
MKKELPYVKSVGYSLIFGAIIFFVSVFAGALNGIDTASYTNVSKVSLLLGLATFFIVLIISVLREKKTQKK